MNRSSLQSQNISSGPYSLVSCRQKLWKSHKSKLSKLGVASRQSDLFSECLQYLQVLQDLNASINILGSFEDPSIKTFFFNELIPKTTKNILKCNTLDNGNITTILRECLQQVVLLWINTLQEDHPELTKAVERVLRVAQSYYGCKEFQSAESNGQKAVPRSTLFDDFIENLSKEKFLDKISGLVNDTKKWLQSLRMMTIICSAIAHLSFVFPKDSAIELMSRVREFIKERLLHNTESYLDCFKGNNPMTFLKAYNLLLRRLGFPSQEKHREIDLLKLQISSICLKSDVYDTRFLGLRMMNQVIHDVKNPQLVQLKSLNRSEYNQLLHGMFGQVYKDEVVWKKTLDKSLQLLRYAIEHDLLVPDDSVALKGAISLLMQAGRSVKQKIMGKIPLTSSYWIMLDVIIQLGPYSSDSDTVGPIDYLLSDLYAKANQSKEFAEKAYTFCWKVLTNSDSSLDENVWEKILKKIKTYSTGNAYSCEHAPRIINDCCEQLEKDLTKLSLFRLLAEETHHTGRYGEDQDKERIANILKERRFFEVLITHIKTFKQRSAQELGKELANHASRASYKVQFVIRIRCLMKITAVFGGKQYLPYDTLNELWELFIEQALTPDEKDIIFSLLRSIAISWPEYRCISNDDLQKFFDEKINKSEGLYHLRQSKKGVECFQGFFLTINANSKNLWKILSTSDFIVKVQPEQLEGFKTLWILLMSSEENAAEDVIKFLVEIYSSLEDYFEGELCQIRERCVAKCFEYIKEIIADKTSLQSKLREKQCLRCLRLISSMMDQSKTNGIGKAIVHSQLTKGEQLTINIEYRDQLTVQNLLINTDSNSTLFELFKEVTQQVKLDLDEVKLYYPEPPIYISKNLKGRTLSDIGIKTNTTLLAMKRTIRWTELLHSQDSFNPRVEKTLISVFEQFSDNGKMSPEQYRDFIEDEGPAIQGGQVQNVFESADSDKDGYLTLRDFLDFYRACQNNPGLVWTPLMLHIKRNDLRDPNDIGKVDECALVSNIISSNSLYYNALFSLLDSEDVIAEEAWKLLCRMPTSPWVFENVVLMTGVRGVEDSTKRDWNFALNMNSKYQALYALNIIEYLLNPKQQHSLASVETAKLLEYEKTWGKDFIEHGGLEHLCNIFNLFKPNERTVFDQSCKRVLQFSKAMSQKFTFGPEETLGFYEGTFEDKISKFVEMLSEYQTRYLCEERYATVLARKFLSKFEKKDRRYCFYL